jgi:hypothetical protein
MPWFTVQFSKEIEVSVESATLKAAEKAACAEAYKKEPLDFLSESWDANIYKTSEPSDKTDAYYVLDGRLKPRPNFEEIRALMAQGYNNLSWPDFPEPAPVVDTKTLSLFKEAKC